MEELLKIIPDLSRKEWNAEKEPMNVLQVNPPQGESPDIPSEKSKSENLKVKRTVFTRHQLTALEIRFVKQTFLSKEERQEMAKELGLKERQVMIWFQNRRGRLKKRGPTDAAYTADKLDELNNRRPYPFLHGVLSSKQSHNIISKPPLQHPYNNRSGQSCKVKRYPPTNWEKNNNGWLPSINHQGMATGNHHTTMAGRDQPTPPHTVNNLVVPPSGEIRNQPKASAYDSCGSQYYLPPYQMQSDAPDCRIFDGFNSTDFEWNLSDHSTDGVGGNTTHQAFHITGNTDMPYASQTLYAPNEQNVSICTTPSIQTNANIHNLQASQGNVMSGQLVHGQANTHHVPPYNCKQTQVAKTHLHHSAKNNRYNPYQTVSNNMTSSQGIPSFDAANCSHQNSETQFHYLQGRNNCFDNMNNNFSILYSPYTCPSNQTTPNEMLPDCLSTPDLHFTFNIPNINVQ